MPTVREIEQALFRLAPKEGAMDWDNVGQLLGDPDREVRKAPTRKAAARAGVLEYYDWEPGEAVEYTPRRVAIPVKMHIGAPSQPLVAVGDRVERGQLIARCPEGAMGAQIHASITGVVAAVGDRIVIESR